MNFIKKIDQIKAIYVKVDFFLLFHVKKQKNVWKS